MPGPMRWALLCSALAVALAACDSTVESGTGDDGGEGGADPATTATTGGATTAASTSGAGGQAPTCDPPPGISGFAQGTGEKCFEPVQAAEVVPMMQGPQGGYHLWLALGCDDCSSPAHIRYGVNDPATGLAVPDTYPTETLVSLSGAWPQKAGIICGLPGLSWDPEYAPPLPEGTHVVVWVEVLEGSTVVKQSSVEVVIGETQSWDPCVEDPEHELCGFG